MNKNFRDREYILFDLDGTITDPGEGITRSVAYALAKFGINIEDRSVLYPFIGPPLKDSFMQFYGFDEEKAILAMSYFREYFSTKGIFENEMIKGMKELLSELHSAGRKVVLATSKPEQFARVVLETFGLTEYFYFITGSDMEETRADKAAVIEYIIKKCNISDTQTAVMVGDRKFDCIGAGRYGIETIGVLFGYGDYEELKAAGAAGIVENVEELRQLLL